MGYVKTLHKFKTYFCARLLQRLYNIVGPVNAEIQGRKCSVAGVRDKIMDLMGVMAAMVVMNRVSLSMRRSSLRQWTTPGTAHGQSYAAPSEMGCPRSPQRIEIEQGAIEKFHAKIYATIFEATADGIAQRYGIQILKKDLL